jgi:ABC-type Fe3+ transport system permease subunit
MRLFRIAISVAMAFCLLPLAAVILSALIAGYAGCQLDEGGAHPCVIGGHDYGETLVTMFVSGWFALITVPILMVLVPVWIARELLHRRKAGKAAASAKIA